MEEPIRQNSAKMFKQWFDKVLYDFLVTVKGAPHGCVIRTDLPKT